MRRADCRLTLVLLGACVLGVTTRPLCAQESATRPLPPRLADAEARIARKQQKSAPFVQQSVGWTTPELSGNIEPVNDAYIPPSPVSIFEGEDSQQPDADPIAELRRLIEQQNTELQRQSLIIDDLQSRADAQPPAPVVTNISTVPGSVFDGIYAAPSYLPDGLTFISKDGNFKTHLGGVVQLDAIGFGAVGSGITVPPPPSAGVQNAVDFRRLRLRAEGTMYSNIDWVMESDYALALQNTDQANPAAPVTGLRSFPAGNVQGGNTVNLMQPTTIFMTFKDIPILGNIRVGNQQNWISLEHIESARFLDFMERSTIMDAFSGPNNNGYVPGISTFNTTPDQMLGWQLGIYKNNAYDSGLTYSIGNAWIYGGRLISTPYYDEESKGRYLVHIGVGSEYRTFNQNVGATQGYDNVRIRSRGLLRNAASTLDANYADTGNFFATCQTLVNPEFAIQWGPLLLQGEYTASFINGAKPAKNIDVRLDTVFMHGGYIEALYFLTGENRAYNRQSGVFGRVIPKENANIREDRWGAWQTGLRYNFLNLNSGTLVNGGKEQDFTAGLNWFLNPNTRFQFNYVCTWVNNNSSVTYPGSTGSLNGARFVGEGIICSFGGRLDFNY